MGLKKERRKEVQLGQNGLRGAGEKAEADTTGRERERERKGKAKQSKATERKKKERTALQRSCQVSSPSGPVKERCYEIVECRPSVGTPCLRDGSNDDEQKSKSMALQFQASVSSGMSLRMTGLIFWLKYLATLALFFFSQRRREDSSSSSSSSSKGHPVHPIPSILRSTSSMLHAHVAFSFFSPV